MIGTGAIWPVPLPCSAGKYRETLDFTPEIEQIVAGDGLHIKGLLDQFPTRANRELNRPNREANPPNREASGSRLVYRAGSRLRPFAARPSR